MENTADNKKEETQVQQEVTAAKESPATERSEEETKDDKNRGREQQEGSIKNSK